MLHTLVLTQGSGPVSGLPSHSSTGLSSQTSPPDLPVCSETCCDPAQHWPFPLGQVLALTPLPVTYLMLTPGLLVLGAPPSPHPGISLSPTSSCSGPALFRDLLPRLPQSFHPGFLEPLPGPQH
jgi:hypothetical protein